MSFSPCMIAILRRSQWAVKNMKNKIFSINFWYCLRSTVSFFIILIIEKIPILFSFQSCNDTFSLPCEQTDTHTLTSFITWKIRCKDHVNVLWDKIIGIAYHSPISCSHMKRTIPCHAMNMNWEPFHANKSYVFDFLTNALCYTRINTVYFYSNFIASPHRYM